MLHPSIPCTMLHTYILRYIQPHASPPGGNMGFPCRTSSHAREHDIRPSGPVRPWAPVGQALGGSCMYWMYRSWGRSKVIARSSVQVTVCGETSCFASSYPCFDMKTGKPTDSTTSTPPVPLVPLSPFGTWERWVNRGVSVFYMMNVLFRRTVFYKYICM